MDKLKQHYEEFQVWLEEKEYAYWGEWDMYDADGMMTTVEAQWELCGQEFLNDLANGR